MLPMSPYSMDGMPLEDRQCRKTRMWLQSVQRTFVDVDVGLADGHVRLAVLVIGWWLLASERSSLLRTLVRLSAICYTEDYSALATEYGVLCFALLCSALR